MTIQWFPGHMTKARRQIEEKLKLIDVVIELLDARIPYSSRNPMIDDIIRDKPRLVLFNKADLADASVTALWMADCEAKGQQALAVDAASGTGIQSIAARCKQLAAAKRDAMIRKGARPRPVRALIVGIPNVGKSTLINRLAGKSIAATGDRPGVTKGQQWIKVGAEMELLDTPGILWPKFEEEQVGIHLAATGAIKDELLHVEDIAYYMIRELLAGYPETLAERYGITKWPDHVEGADPEAIVAVMEAIGKRRGCVVSGGRIDLEQASMVILRDLRSGKLGRVSLERPVQEGV